MVDMDNKMQTVRAHYIEIPGAAQYVLDGLHQAGYEAYIVGGCVRDSILGRTPGDWDVTTSATPDQVKSVFPRTVDTGIEHGTVTVLTDGDPCEVTTYRIDGVYEDARHPKEVTFTRSLEEDLKRRDFTINAMAYCHESGIIDLFGGMEDLKEGIIRCVGDPKERFSEDALRMMRAVRFAAQLGFEIEEGVQEAIREMADQLDRISAERIRTELVKMIVSPHPSWFRLAYKTGITSVIMPEFDRIMVQEQNSPHHIYTVGEHTLVAMKQVRADKILRLTLLLHDMGKPDVRTVDGSGHDHFKGHAARSKQIAENILKRLKFDNETARTVTLLVANHSLFPQLSARDIRRTAYELGGPELFDLFLEVKRADILAHHPDLVIRNLDYLEQLERIWEDIRYHHDCLSLSELAISGEDLIRDGMKPGKEMGELLQNLLYEVLDHPEKNSREYLLAQSRQLRYEGEDLA